KKPHPARIAPERQRSEIREYEAVHYRSFEPGRIVQMFLPVGGETLQRAINEAIIQFTDADDAADLLGMFPQLIGNQGPGFGARIGNARGMDQNSSPSIGGPATDFDGFSPMSEQSRPRLFQRK